jgi:hypothetical protein
MAAVSLFVSPPYGIQFACHFRAAANSIAQHNRAHRPLPDVKFGSVSHFYPLIYLKIHSAF